MCDRAVIHVFIGAPATAPSCVAGGAVSGWQDIAYAPCRPDGRSRPGLDGGCCENANDGGPDGATGDVSELVSSTELCRITEWVHRGSGGRSAAPEHPGKSAAPEHPGKSAAPEHPGKSAAPEHPGKSAAPEHPRKSAAPEHPGKSATPDHPGKSVAPEHPGKSAAPEHPGKSATPDHPGKSAAPDHPGKSAAPDHPGKSAAPEHPGKSAAPEHPGKSAAPEHPGKSAAPEHPGETPGPVISAETEFLTVLTSSQLSIKSLENNGTTTTNHLTQRTSELEDAATDSASQDAIASSAELFTDTFEEAFDKKSQKSDPAVFHTEVTSALPVAEDPGSARNKRKTLSSAPSNSPKDNPHSKKSKPSLSPVQRGTKRDDDHRPQTPAKSLTLLKHCWDRRREYNVMVVVLQPCHVKEIRVRSGPNVGSTLPLAAIVVTDQSEIKLSVLLWRSAAFWSLSLLPGDIVALTNLSVCKDRWREDERLQSTFRSKLVKLGSCSTLLSGEGPRPIEHSAVKALLDYVQVKHAYLCELSPRQPQTLEHVQYVSLAELQPELVLHVIVKVNNVSVLKEATYHFKGLQQNKIILTVEQTKGKTRTLVLWGTCASWCDQVHLKIDHTWVFKYLLCKKNIVSGDLELHTTPWSSCECLFDDDQRAIDFQKTYNITSAKQMSLLTMLEEKCSGEIQVKGSILQIEFHIPGRHRVFMNHKTSISDILTSLPDIIYTGCGKCQRELNTDDNNVYEQCYSCLPFNQVKVFYRSAQMTVMSDECCVSVLVPPDMVRNLLLNIPPNLLPKVFPSSKDITYGTILADLCHSLLAQTGQCFVFTIKSQFMLDDNSVPLEEDFHLLDFHLDNENDIG